MFWKSKKIRTRFAPSPTGNLHMGNYRTALFSWLFAESQKGSFVLRIEDTDKERSKKEYEENILKSLEWLGLDHDKKYIQSENIESHKKYLKRLIDKDIAFISKEEEGNNSEVIRFRNPNKKVSFTDLIRGEIEFDTTELGNFVIAKNMDEPLFHLAVVVDDFEEGITHIFRGEDHISNTPRQLLIQEAIGATTPTYVHLPLVLNKEREKLSKRGGAKSVLEYKEEGFSREAIVNYLALLGWNPGTEKEIFTIEELVEEFDVRKIHKGGATFDETKLRWINKEHLRLESEKEQKLAISKMLKKTAFSDKINDDIIEKLSPMFLERIETYGDIKTLISDGELDFVFYDPAPGIKDVVLSKLLESEEEKYAYKKTFDHLTYIKTALEKISASSFIAEKIKESVWDYATENGRGEVLWPFRFALTGKKQSPDPFSVASVLGKDETIKRVEHILEKLEKAYE